MLFDLENALDYLVGEIKPREIKFIEISLKSCFFKNVQKSSSGKDFSSWISSVLIFTIMKFLSV